MENTLPKIITDQELGDILEEAELRLDFAEHLCIAGDLERLEVVETSQPVRYYDLTPKTFEEAA